MRKNNYGCKKKLSFSVARWTTILFYDRGRERTATSGDGLPGARRSSAAGRRARFAPRVRGCFCGFLPPVRPSFSAAYRCQHPRVPTPLSSQSIILLLFSFHGVCAEHAPLKVIIVGSCVRIARVHTQRSGRRTFFPSIKLRPSTFNNAWTWISKTSALAILLEGKKKMIEKFRTLGAFRKQLGAIILSSERRFGRASRPGVVVRG